MPRQSLAASFVPFLLMLFAGYIASLWLLRDSVAIESIQFSLQDITSGELQLEGVTSQLGFSPSGKLQLTLSAETVSAPGVSGTINSLSLHCREFQPMPALACRGGVLALVTPAQQSLKVAVDIDYQMNEEQLSIQFGALDGFWRALSIKWQSGKEQQIRVRGQGITHAVYALVSQFVTLPELTLTAGTADINVTMSLLRGELRSITLSGVLNAATLSNLETTQAMEGVSGTVELQANHKQGVWQGQLGLDIASGFIYSDPVGINASSHPLTLSSAFNWQATGDVVLSDLRWQQPGVANLTTSLRFKLGEQFQLMTLDVNAQSLVLGAVFPAYIQPWLYEFDLPALDFKGSVSGDLHWSPETVRLSARLDDVAVQEAEGQFGVNGLDGQVNWSNAAEQRHSEFGWKQANFYQLPFGATQIALSSSQNEFYLTQPITIPFLDGAIQVEDGFMRDMGTEAMAWSFDAYLEPVSMLQLTEALGWQTFGGKLSGMIPELRYQERQLQLDGTLLVSAFDGSITVNNLQVDEPFSLVPRLQADIVMDNLDLKAVTGAFSFGRIEGRLDGYINSLDMLAWQPVKFDALLITPPDDKSRHRISQRAVDNLTKIGGGVGGALSRSFMRFFEDFSYDKLGLGCRLENGVCQMRGAQSTEQGYYIVKGGLLPPRIDIVGYANQVDWRQLVNQLIEVTRNGEVTVE